MKKNNKGFTLIELLVVIAIIGLLSTLAVVALNSARMKSRDARRLSDVKQIQTALELFYNDQGMYPPSGVAANTSLFLGTGNQVCLDAGGWDATCVAGDVYMAAVPSYPSPRTDNICDPTTDDQAVGYSYINHTATDASTYTLQYCLGGASGGVAVGENVACESGISGCIAP